MRAWSVVVLTLSVARVAEAQTCAVMAVAMDESASMENEQNWLLSELSSIFGQIEKLGFENNILCVTGFGYSSSERNFGCAFYTSSSGWPFSSFSTGGGTEDGYLGLSAALTQAEDFLAANKKICPKSVNAAILITDEDRDVASSVTEASLQSQIVSGGWIVNAILNLYNMYGIIGVTSEGKQYVVTDDGYGIIDGGGVEYVYAYESAEEDYFDLAWLNDGVVWNLNTLRSGGAEAAAFSEAFVDIKVDEIIRKKKPRRGVGSALETLGVAASIALTTLTALTIVSTIVAAAIAGVPGSSTPSGLRAAGDLIGLIFQLQFLVLTASLSIPVKSGFRKFGARLRWCQFQLPGMSAEHGKSQEFENARKGVPDYLAAAKVSAEELLVQTFATGVLVAFLLLLLHIICGYIILSIIRKKYPRYQFPDILRFPALEIAVFTCYFSGIVQACAICLSLPSVDGGVKFVAFFILVAVLLIMGLLLSFVLEPLARGHFPKYTALIRNMGMRFFAFTRLLDNAVSEAGRREAAATVEETKSAEERKEAEVHDAALESEPLDADDDEQKNEEKKEDTGPTQCSIGAPPGAEDEPTGTDEELGPEEKLGDEKEEATDEVDLVPVSIEEMPTADRIRLLAPLSFAVDQPHPAKERWLKGLSAPHHSFGEWVVESVNTEDVNTYYAWLLATFPMVFGRLTNAASYFTFELFFMRFFYICLLTGLSGTNGKAQSSLMFLVSLLKLVVVTCMVPFNSMLTNIREVVLSASHVLTFLIALIALGAETASWKIASEAMLAVGIAVTLSAILLQLVTTGMIIGFKCLEWCSGPANIQTGPVVLAEDHATIFRETIIIEFSRPFAEYVAVARKTYSEGRAGRNFPVTGSLAGHAHHCGVAAARDILVGDDEKSIRDGVVTIGIEVLVHAIKASVTIATVEAVHKEHPELAGFSIETPIRTCVGFVIDRVFLKAVEKIAEWTDRDLELQMTGLLSSLAPDADELVEEDKSIVARSEDQRSTKHKYYYDPLVHHSAVYGKRAFGFAKSRVSEGIETHRASSMRLREVVTAPIPSGWTASYNLNVIVLLAGILAFFATVFASGSAGAGAWTTFAVGSVADWQVGLYYLVRDGSNDDDVTKIKESNRDDIVNWRAFQLNRTTTMFSVVFTLIVSMYYCISSCCFRIQAIEIAAGSLLVFLFVFSLAGSSYWTDRFDSNYFIDDDNILDDKVICSDGCALQFFNSFYMLGVGLFMLGYALCGCACCPLRDAPHQGGSEKNREYPQLPVRDVEAPVSTDPARLECCGGWLTVSYSRNQGQANDEAAAAAAPVAMPATTQDEKHIQAVEATAVEGSTSVSDANAE